MGPPAHFAVNEASVLQGLDVLRGRSERHIEGLCELAYGFLSIGKLAQHPPARDIAKGVKNGIELSGAIFNHTVECMAAWG